MKHKRSYKKRGARDQAPAPIKDEKAMTDEEVVRSILDLIHEGHEVYRGIFLYLRRELIKSVGKTRDLKKEFEMKAAAEAQLAMEETK